MTQGRLAESILALVLPPDRATAIAGDLIEDAPGPLGVWAAVLRIVCDYVWGDLRRFFLPMAAGAAAWWFLYAVQSVVYTFLGNLLVYLAGHHTGLELLTDLPWPPPPPSPDSWVGPLVWWAAMPYACARGMARRWPGREVAAWTALTVAWGAMSVVTKIPLPAVPVVPLFTLLGALDARRRVIVPA